MANANMFIGVQGGGSHAIGYFDNSLLLLLHHVDYFGERSHWEYPHAYKFGPYKYLNNHSLTLAVACNLKEFQQGLYAIATSNISKDDGKFSLNGPNISLLKPLIT